MHIDTNLNLFCLKVQRLKWKKTFIYQYQKKTITFNERSISTKHLIKYYKKRLILLMKANLRMDVIKSWKE